MTDQKFNIEAKGEYIIVKAIDENSDKPFEVVDPNKRSEFLTVLSVGDDVESCDVGDKVIPYGSEFQAFVYKEQQYIVLTDSQVLGVVNV